MVALPVPWPAFRERGMRPGCWPPPEQLDAAGRLGDPTRPCARDQFNQMNSVQPDVDGSNSSAPVSPHLRPRSSENVQRPPSRSYTSRSIDPTRCTSPLRTESMSPGKSRAARATAAPLLLGTTARYSCASGGGPSQMSFSVILTEKGGPTQRLDFECEEITIGRVDENDICLPKGNISKKHTRILVKDGKIIVLDLRSTNGTYVNGRKLAGPQLISPADKVYIGDFILNVEPPDVEPPDDEPGEAESEAAPADGDEAAEMPTMTPAVPHYVGGEATKRDAPQAVPVQPPTPTPPPPL